MAMQIVRRFGTGAAKSHLADATALILHGTSNMTESTAAEFVPATHSLSKLRAAAADCEGCDLFRHATQTVFGEGDRASRLMLVGEQPGDQEDRAGHPFVGPAGRLLDDVLQEVGIDRKTVYVTNAVKHFKWTERGKRRLHAKPSSREIKACRPWLDAEIDAIKPEVIVLLGATAAQSFLGPKFRITKQRGQWIDGGEQASWLMATYHPSAILRAPDSEARQRMRDEFSADLKSVAKRLRA
jgi:DNA polymerase